MHLIEICIYILGISAALCAGGAMMFYTWFLCARYFTDYVDRLAEEQFTKLQHQEIMKRRKA